MIRGTFMDSYRKGIMAEKKRKRDETDGSFLMVTQRHWEDDIIWDSEITKESEDPPCETRNISSSQWIPNLHSRNNGHRPEMYHFSSVSSNVIGNSNPLQKFKIIEESSAGVPNNGIVHNVNGAACSSSHSKSRVGISMLPIENPDLVHYYWEDDIIWDAEEEDPEMWRELIPCYDANDDNVIVNFPVDTRGAADTEKLSKEKGKSKVKVNSPTSKKLLEDIKNGNSKNGQSQSEGPVDSYNISNDQYYSNAESIRKSLSTFNNKRDIVHSKPVQDFHPLLFPATQFHHYALKGYHRPSVRGLLDHQKFYSVQGVNKFAAQMKKKYETRLRKVEVKQDFDEDVPRQSSPFENIVELSGRYGEILLVEYCEQFPPLLCQVGMHSTVINYVPNMRKTFGLECKYGEFDVAGDNTFLGTLGKDTVLQTLENNMYRCPIYEQPVNLHFLVIRAGNHLYLREIDAIFTGGQQSPMCIVPQPKSKVSAAFTKDLLKIEICRLFLKSKSIPKTINMTDIKASFPNVAESAIRRVLNDMADYQRSGFAGTWKMKNSLEFILPPETELAKIITPEQFCINYSSASAELRLKMLGYTEKHFMSNFKLGEDNDNNEEFVLNKMEEVNCAPWNTTRAFMSAMKGNTILDVNGPADPTGCGEGFSYIRTSNRPNIQDPEQKKCINGTKVDLRKLGVVEAKKVLKSFGVEESKYKKLSRWEMIDAIRTLATENTGEEGQNYSRVNPMSLAERRKRYSRDCQHIFDLQNIVLSSNELLSSDEGEDCDSDNSDIEEAGKLLEDMITKDVSQSQEEIDLETEERERSELIKMLLEEKKDAQPEESSSTKKKRVLKIHRTYSKPGGNSYTVTETIRNQDVIDIYEQIHKMGTKAEDILKSGILKKGANRLKANEKRLELDRARRLKRKEQQEIKRAGDELYSAKAKSKFRKNGRGPGRPKKHVN